MNFFIVNKLILFLLYTLERVRGIEPLPPAWKARVLPLYDTRASYRIPNSGEIGYNLKRIVINKKLMENTSGWPTVGQLLKQSWETYKSRFKTLLLVSLVGVGVTFVVSLIFGGSMMFGQTETYTIGSAAPSLDINWALVIIMGIIIIIVAFLQQAALVHAVSSPTDPGVGASYSIGWKKFLPFLWTGVFGGILTAIGLVLLIVPGIIIAVWFSMTSFIVMMEGKNGWSALAASKDYVKGRWTKVFVYLLVMAVLALVIPLVLNLIGKNIGQLIGNLLITPWTIAYCYEVYKTLKNHPQPAAAIQPAPLVTPVA